MKTIQIALAASLGLALAPLARATDTTGGTTPTTTATETQAHTQTHTQTRDQVRAQVHDALVHHGDATEQEASEVDGEVSDHAGTHGYGQAIKDAIQKAHADGCTGQCQVKLIHAINGAMDNGKTPDQAAKDATANVAAHATGKPSDPQARSESRRQDAAHRDAAADRVRDRTTDRGQAGSHAMGGGRR